MPTGITMRERSGWRDEAISRRHRLWGVELQATDIDWLVSEYRSESGDIRPAAIVEYKKGFANSPNLNSPQYIVIGKLATRADLPFFVCHYTADCSQFSVTPANGWAKKILSCTKNFSEEDYIRLGFFLRGYPKNSPECERAIKNLKQQSNTAGQSSLF